MFCLYWKLGHRWLHFSVMQLWGTCLFPSLVLAHGTQPCQAKHGLWTWKARWCPQHTTPSPGNACPSSFPPAYLSESSLSLLLVPDPPSCHQPRADSSLTSLALSLPADFFFFFPHKWALLFTHGMLSTLVETLNLDHKTNVSSQEDNQYFHIFSMWYSYTF